MRRLLVALTVVAFVAALLPMGALAATAQQAAPQPSIRPEQSDDTAVRTGRRVRVGGPANGSTIKSAALLGLGPDGEVKFEQPVNPALLNRGPSAQAPDQDYLRVVDGQFDGRIELRCGFNDPALRCTETYPGATGEISGVALRVDVDGATGRSNVVRVDYVEPEILRYELIDNEHIRVVFSEPVRAAEGDKPADWAVTPDGTPSGVAGLRPLQVTDPKDPSCHYPEPQMTTGCTRLLTIPPQDEDASPFVQYQPDVIGRLFSTYRDYADNTLKIVPAENSEALDLIRPAVPTISSVGGRTPSGGSARGNDADPAVRVDNVREGHDVTVTATGPGGTVSQTATVPAGQSTVTVELPALTADGAYTITAVAIDPSGNRSDESQKSPPRTRPDGGPATVTYVLDTVAPLAVAAKMTGAREVRVLFSEPIRPDGHAGRWRIGDQDATAKGSGSERTVRTAADIAAGATVTWEPTEGGATTAGRYHDDAGNALPAFELPLVALPGLPAPTVVEPAAETYTRASRVVIAGKAPDASGLVVDLYERNSDAPAETTEVRNGAWRFERDLPSDARYQFEVQLRDTSSGARSARIGVPDIVRDTTPPDVEVTQPGPAPLTEQLDGKRRYGVGDGVTVEWRATDAAVGDTQRADHGDTVSIALVFEDRTQRVVATGLPHTPGETRTYTYTITEADLAGLGQREARFRVTLTDLAGNTGSDDSSPFVILASLLGWRAYLVERNVIEARFDVVLSGSTAPGEWYIDERPAQTVTKTERDGRTIIRLTDAATRDVNATPTVRYEPATVNLTPLRGPKGREISLQPRNAIDAIAPALSVETSSPGGPIDAETFRVSGTTDESTRPNTVAAYRADIVGNLQGSAIQTTTAGSDGRWTMDVPLTANAVNRIVLRAVDPAGNLSHTIPQPPLKVVEDSLAPMVRITTPEFAELVAPEFDIRWTTVEANLASVRVEYRSDGGPWQTLYEGATDPGHFRWQVPENIRRAVLGLRVTVTDATAKTGEDVVDGVRLDFAAPTMVKARASGAQVVDVTFSEEVSLDGSGFTIGGANVRRIKGDGLKRTFILDRAVDSTTPEVAYSGTNVRDAAGNELQAASVTAKRSFAFAVTALRGQRVTTNRVRVTWTDTRNQTADLRGYRVYRNGSPIALVGSATRAFTDAKGTDRNVYSVRAVDDRRRVSSVRRVVVR